MKLSSIGMGIGALLVLLLLLATTMIAGAIGLLRGIVTLLIAQG